MIDPLETHVIQQVQSRFHNALEFLRTLVGQPSVLGNERGAQQVVLQRLQQAGLQPEEWDLDIPTLRQHPQFGPLDLDYSGRPNVTAHWPAQGSGGRSLILNGHIDVVSAEPLANWVHDPWGAAVEGDWLYGRGAADMKAGIAAMLLAVEAVRGAGVGLRGDVILESVIEEECTGNGTLACAQRGLRADAALLPEPMHLGACIGTVGVFWFRVRTVGEAKLLATADKAANAIEQMFPIVAALRRLERDLNAAERPGLFHDWPHPLNLNVGVIRGGDWPSTVPSACTLECRFACLPGMRVEDAQAAVLENISAAAREDPWLATHPPVVEFFGFRAEPSVTELSAPPMPVLAACHQDVVGSQMRFFPSNVTTDQRYFVNQLAVPATSYGPIGENSHAGEERVYLPSVLQTAQVLALFIVRWCGVQS